MILAVLCAVTQFTVTLIAEESDHEKVVALVNAQTISEFQLKRATRLTADSSPADRKKALEKLIDETLLLQAARKVGWTVPPDVVQERINSIVTEEFAGDRSKFEAALEAGGYSMKDFEKSVKGTFSSTRCVPRSPRVGPPPPNSRLSPRGSTELGRKPPSPP
jgi:parvulin-like peptidyl-prolyl isomerase